MMKKQINYLVGGLLIIICEISCGGKNDKTYDMANKAYAEAEDNRIKILKLQTQVDDLEDEVNNLKHDKIDRR
jgi:hypothetical protein